MPVLPAQRVAVPDGRQEILMGNRVYDAKGRFLWSCGASAGIVALGSADGDWPPTRPVYNEASYADTNVTDSLAVPTAPEAPWLARGGVFRGQISSLWREGMANARVAITDVCVASCDPAGRVHAWVQVWNDGDRALPSTTEVTLSGTVDGATVVIETRALGADLAAGASVNLLFEATTAECGAGLDVVIDGPEALAECHEEDNEGRYADLGCP